MRPMASHAAVVVAALAIAGCGGGSSDRTGEPAAKPTRAEQREPPRAAIPTAEQPAGTEPSRTVRGPRIRLSSLKGRVAFSRENDIWIADADGSHARRVTRTRGPQDGPTWSPDGRTLAYRDARRGYNVNDEIYAVDADGSRTRRLTRTPFNEWSPAWSPDGRLIAFYASELYVMRPDGGGVRQLTEVQGEYPAWAPDGRRLAFMSAQPGARGSNPNYDIFVVNVDGTGLRQLTDWPGEDGWPAWSPDGKWLAFTSSHDETGESLGRSVYLMRPDGSQKRRLALPMAAFSPVWSPDGKTILFTATRPGDTSERLWVVRPDGTGWRRTSMTGGIAAWSAHER